ncbi:hypothetical protein LE181_18250 [Streptomyces sp. SCA3-4]|uniref:hypothetical protein n=1 Tax=Streptomyces sichuanensis TaxID=2871810 RepID=UPI001CE37C56|nr:hypothetical protein [Streptomyces sichuanensis]MCA6094096.1 hypothetical protein [Streptomyces sichuanensis]
MNYLRGFMPWIAFAVVSSYGWQWGAAAGLATAVALLVKEHQAGTARQSLILEHSTAGYFAALTALAFALPHSELQHFGGAMSLGWLALTAWATLAVGHPFTTGIAKRQAPPQVWNTPLFRRINIVITAAWALAFTLAATALAIADANDLGTNASIAIQAAGFALPAAFTARYPERARARHAQAAQ